MPAKILMVEDDTTTRFFLSRILSDDGYEVTEAGSAEEALEILGQQTVDLVVLDMKLPGRSGLDILPELLSQDPNLPVIFITGESTVDLAVQAMKLRACDFIEKPPDIPTLRRVIAHLLRTSQLQQEVERLRTVPSDSANPFITGQTRRMARVLELAEKVAPTTATVLITGENGTGKERFANLIHARSGRAGNSLVAINCAAVPKDILESELFGSMKGAFSGAVTRKGLLEQANGGTLFLDEISAMNTDMQAKLLRVLESKTTRRLGATIDMQVDVRIIAASNRDLKAMMADGSFRQDLYYRLAVFSVDLPPLRERVADIPTIAAAYIDHFNRLTGRDIEGLTPEALACLEAYPWPGNVRELRNIIERAVILSDSPQIGLEHLPPEITSLSLKVTKTPIGDPDSGDTLALSLPDMERRLISEALEHFHGDVDAAAQALGISVEELKQRLNGRS